ncbi:hypothetical protein RQN30_10420 [Arcanobacterium hippocoleae]
MSAGKIPTQTNEIILSAATAKELNIDVGARISLIWEKVSAHKTTEVLVAGISKRSPFAQEPKRFELFLQTSPHSIHLPRLTSR